MVPVVRFESAGEEITSECKPAAALKKSVSACLISLPSYASAMRIVPLSRCSKMLLSRMDDFGFGTEEISFHSALFLKKVRTPKAAPQYKLCAGSSPFPSVGNRDDALVLVIGKGDECVYHARLCLCRGRGSCEKEKAGREN